MEKTKMKGQIKMTNDPIKQALENLNKPQTPQGTQKVKIINGKLVAIPHTLSTLSSQPNTPPTNFRMPKTVEFINGQLVPSVDYAHTSEFIEMKSRIISALNYCANNLYDNINYENFFEDLQDRVLETINELYEERYDYERLD